MGISSVTDSRNQTTFYEYDVNNRLSVVKDNNMDIIKSYCYNYAGQSTNCYIQTTPPATQSNTIYAKFNFNYDTPNYSYNDPHYFYYYQTGSVSVSFYSDVAHTQPLAIPNALNIKITKNHTQTLSSTASYYYTENTVTNLEINVPAASTNFTLLPAVYFSNWNATIEGDFAFYSDETWDYTFPTSTDYIIVN